MRFHVPVFAVVLASATAATLNDVCTPSYVRAHLPPPGFYQGVSLDPSSVTANPVSQVSVADSNFFPDATFDYCNVSFTYSHDGLEDQVALTYWLPAPGRFQNRFLATGGGGYAINSGNQSLPGGIIYGAVSGLTDAGFGAAQSNTITQWLDANGTLNWHKVHMFGYQGIREMSELGKAFTKSFFNMTQTNTTLYTYWQGCSEGGREGWSQVQRYEDSFDGAIVGAPAFRWSFQQTQLLYPNVVEQTMDYYPSPCELQKIVNETIINCDPLDGKTDGVVARTDLCYTQYVEAANFSTIAGQPYACPATPATAGSPAIPVQQGNVTKQAVAVAKKILEGLHDSQGRRVYFAPTPGAQMTEAQTGYNATTQQWGLSVISLGGVFVEVEIHLRNGSNLPDLDGVTYDTLKDWITEGMQRFQGVLETTWPDLTPYRDAGGKVLMFHGEADWGIPTASSVRYWESVRKIMNPGQSYNDSAAAQNEFFKLFLVPGATHCAANPAQPDGPFPQTNLAVMIDWVENGIAPQTLNATVLLGEHKGRNQQICAWPLRPVWRGNNATSPECRFDEQSVDYWNYDLDAFKVPIY
ncbi:Tannase [Cladophialophora carrionii]|uniref:Carboxylic ester hydrolase n=1 Tax=Cladophialophora carrionii TaxID=86049 RepID=A0A1C1D2I1_9EURO|nr:Tannase [Cladophialophora carrionii]